MTKEKQLTVAEIEQLLEKAKKKPIKLYVLRSIEDRDDWDNGILQRQLDLASFIKIANGGTRLFYSNVKGQERNILLDDHTIIFDNYWHAYAFCLRRNVSTGIVHS